RRRGTALGGGPPRRGARTVRTRGGGQGGGSKPPPALHRYFPSLSFLKPSGLPSHWFNAPVTQEVVSRRPRRVMSSGRAFWPYSVKYQTQFAPRSVSSFSVNAYVGPDEGRVRPSSPRRWRRRVS